MPFSNKIETDRFKTYSLVVFLLLVLINSINSLIGYHPDQHYQIIEFANFKLGRIEASEVAWEYHYQERQGLQPFLIYVYLKVLYALGISDPVKLTQILRVITGLFFTFCLTRFINSTLHLFKPAFQKAYIASSYFFWFIPCYYVHFASETFAQSLMLLGCAFLLSDRNTQGQLVLIGLLFGLAFFARFQSALTSAILLTGFVWTRQLKWQDCLYLGGGIGLGLSIGVLTDVWLYEDWIFTPYRYLDFQLFKGVVNAFGVSPWYYYLTLLLTSSTLLFGILTYLGLAGSMLNRKSFFLSISVLGTIGVLSIIGHKEWRFLLQVLAFFPFLIVYGLQEFSYHFPPLRKVLFFKPFVALLVLLNLALLTYHSLMNSGILSIQGEALMGAVNRNYFNKPARLFYTQIEYHPYMIRGYDPDAVENPFDQTKIRKWFYQPPRLSDQVITDLSCPSLYADYGDSVRLLYINKAVFLADNARDNLLNQGYQLKAATLPLFVDKFIPEQGNPWVDRLNRRIIYLFEKK